MHIESDTTVVLHTATQSKVWSTISRVHIQSPAGLWAWVSYNNRFNHINSLSAELIAICSAYVVSPAITACLFYLQNTQFP